MSDQEVTEYWQHEAELQDHVIVPCPISATEEWTQAGNWE
jgi:hypothetical protein